MLFNHVNQPYDQNKFQSPEQLVVIEDWESEGIHEEGARDKIRLFAPANENYPFVIPQHPYLYKLSDKRYTNDALAEVLAYRLGVRMGVPVPPAFIAYHTKRDTCGVLVEWFYGYKNMDNSLPPHINPSQGEVIEYHKAGGDILQNTIENYDREKGTQHNFIDILQYFSKSSFREELEQSFAKILLFDAVIGNTDRHQDNWKIIELFIIDSVEYGVAHLSLSPAFDNGSSLGHNLLEHKLADKTQKIEEFNRKGRHHLKLQRDDRKSIPHLDTVTIIYEYLPECLEPLLSCLNIPISDIESDLQDIQTLEAKLPSGIRWLTDTRIDFIMSLLHTRQTYFRGEIEKLC